MEVLAIIPARGGSKGIPNKNIKDLNGKPLIYYSIEAGQKSKYVTRTVLSTESPKIKEVAESFGCEVVDRPMELAQDETHTIPVLIQVLDYLKDKENYNPDVVILLQPTCPLRDAKQIDEAFELFQKSDCDPCCAVRSMGITHAKWYKNLKDEMKCIYDYRNRPRRQDTHLHMPLYCETGSIYIVTTEAMRKCYDFIGDKPVVYIQPSIDIDTPDDFEAIAKILKEREDKKD